jgi:hypothetical protein
LLTKKLTTFICAITIALFTSWITASAQAGSAIPFEPKFYPKLTEKVRAALMPEYAKLPNNYSTVRYDKDKYLMSDDHDIISANRKNFVARDDGGFDVVFGGMDCQSIVKKRGTNFGYTPMES